MKLTQEQLSTLATIDPTYLETLSELRAAIKSNTDIKNDLDSLIAERVEYYRHCNEMRLDDHNILHRIVVRKFGSTAEYFNGYINSHCKDEGFYPPTASNGSLLKNGYKTDPESKFNSIVGGRLNLVYVASDKTQLEHIKKIKQFYTKQEADRQNKQREAALQALSDYESDLIEIYENHIESLNKSATEANRLQQLISELSK